MENKKFTAGFAGMAKAVIVRAAVITFVCAIVFIGAFGDFDGVGAVFWLAVIGSFVWEIVHMVTVEVRDSGVTITKAGNTPVFYGFDKCNITTVGKNTIRATMRKSDKHEDIKCAGFTKSTCDELTKYIRKRQQVYGMSSVPMTASGVQMTIDDAAKKQDMNDRLREAAKRAAESSSAAAARNPYAKKTGTTSKPEVTAVPAGAASKPKVTVAPAGTTSKPKITEPGSVKVDAPPTINESITITETPKITEIPGVSDLPKTNDWSEFVRAEPKKSEHNHGEDFHKAVFYYPRRDIEERTERNSTLAILATLAFGVLIFLLAYLAAPMFVLIEAGGIAIVCVIVIGCLIGSKAAKLRGMPSKLEVTENHFVVDNTRYRLGEMTSKSMTPPGTKIGNREIRFGYAGKQITCALGPCAKSEKTADEYFSRYSELCDRLKEKGFKCV